MVQQKAKVETEGGGGSMPAMSEVQLGRLCGWSRVSTKEV